MAGLIWPVGHSWPTAVLEENSWNVSWNQPRPSLYNFTWAELSGHEHTCSHEHTMNIHVHYNNWGGLRPFKVFTEKST